MCPPSPSQLCQEPSHHLWRRPLPGPRIKQSKRPDCQEAADGAELSTPPRLSQLLHVVAWAGAKLAASTKLGPLIPNAIAPAMVLIPVTIAARRDILPEGAV